MSTTRGTDYSHARGSAPCGGRLLAVIAGPWPRGVNNVRGWRRSADSVLLERGLSLCHRVARRRGRNARPEISRAIWQAALSLATMATSETSNHLSLATSRSVGRSVRQLARPTAHSRRLHSPRRQLLASRATSPWRKRDLDSSSGGS